MAAVLAGGALAGCGGGGGNASSIEKSVNKQIEEATE
jgi:hypothetical protein